jgi:hypothetical protein
MPVVPASASIHDIRWTGVAGRRFTRALAAAIPALTRSEINLGQFFYTPFGLEKQ